MNDFILEKLLVIPAIIIGITFHEFAHAKVAIKLGDDTPRLQGRDTLNPLAHIDPIGFICLMIASFGWGKPVEIDPRRFKEPMKGQMLTSLAGPVMNLIIAFISLVVLNVLQLVGVFDVANATTQTIQLTVTYIVLINISLCIFNLLPLPHFDGAKILVYFLPGKWKIRLMEMEKWSLIIFLVIILTPIPQLVITPILTGMLTGMQFLISLVLGVFV